MSITTGTFKLADQPKECFKIKITGDFKGPEAVSVRQQINESSANGYEIIYIDVTEVADTDLSGINEIINSHHTLANASKQLVLLYKKGSVVEKWIDTTGLDKFVAIAILPAE